MNEPLRRHLRNRALTIRQALPGWHDTADLLEQAADEIERLQALVPEQATEDAATDGTTASHAVAPPNPR